MNIKLIIFDWDGVLCDCRDMHYEALNRALGDVGVPIIPRDEHLSIFDGLNTKAKLNILQARHKLKPEEREAIFNLKQYYTKELIDDMVEDSQKRIMLRKLKEKGYTIAVASNSIRESLKLMLVRTGMIDYIDFFYSNEDVKNPKPAAEIYLKCMIKAGVSPKETLIVEDSKHGREAAYNSGGHLLGVTNPASVTVQHVFGFIDDLDSNKVKQKWSDKKMNVLIPMAGKGSRFEQAGYTFPKPLIEVRGKPMIQMVVENLNIDAHYIYIVQKEHYDKYNLKTFLDLITPGCDIIPIDYITQGAACTTLLAQHLINNDNPLLLANSDQYLEWDSSDFMWAMAGDAVDGGIITFKATHPKWSFAKVNDRGFVTEVAEKNPISDNASTGIYYWKKGSDYVKYAEQMISADKKVNGEYYVCPVFNEAIAQGKKIKNYHIDNFWGTGTPEDLNYFLQNHKP